MPNQILQLLLLLLLSLTLTARATNTTFHILSSGSKTVPDETPLTTTYAFNGDYVYFSDVTDGALFTLDSTTGRLTDPNGLIAVGYSHGRHFFDFVNQGNISASRDTSACQCSVDPTTMELSCDCAKSSYFGTYFYEGYYYLVIAPKPRRSFAPVHPKVVIVGSG